MSDQETRVEILEWFCALCGNQFPDPGDCPECKHKLLELLEEAEREQEEVAVALDALGLEEDEVAFLAKVSYTDDGQPVVEVLETANPVRSAKETERLTDLAQPLSGPSTEELERLAKFNRDRLSRSLEQATVTLANKGLPDWRRRTLTGVDGATIGSIIGQEVGETHTNCTTCGHPLSAHTKVTGRTGLDCYGCSECSCSAFNVPTGLGHPFDPAIGEDACRAILQFELEVRMQRSADDQRQLYDLMVSLARRALSVGEMVDEPVPLIDFQCHADGDSLRWDLSYQCSICREFWRHGRHTCLPGRRPGDRWLWIVQNRSGEDEPAGQFTPLRGPISPDWILPRRIDEAERAHNSVWVVGESGYLILQAAEDLVQESHSRQRERLLEDVELR